VNPYDTLTTALVRVTGPIRVLRPSSGLIRQGRTYCPSHQAEGSRAGRTRSLSIAETDQSATVLHCHAGCRPAEVVSAVGLSLASLFPSRCSTLAAPVRASWWGVMAPLDEARCLVARVQAGDQHALTYLGSAISEARGAALSALRGQTRSNHGGTRA
jgi:hypothetical protein